MNRVEDIVFGITGQTLAYRVLSGKPTSGTFKVFDDTEGDDATTPEFSGSVTVDTTSTTVDEASGPSQSDPRELHVAATTGLVLGRLYLLAENSLSEWVEPIEIKAADSIICRHPLKRDYTTAATLKSTYYTVAIDPTFVADEDKISSPLDPLPRWRMRADVVNASAAHEIHYIFFDLVRAQIGHSVVMSDLDARWPGLMRALPADHQKDSGSALIDAAWKSFRADLIAIGMNDTGMRDLEGVDEALVLKLRTILAAGGMAPAGWTAEPFYRLAREEYDAYFEANYKVRLARAVATSTDGGADRDHLTMPIWSK